MQKASLAQRASADYNVCYKNHALTLVRPRVASDMPLRRARGGRPRRTTAAKRAGAQQGSSVSGCRRLHLEPPQDMVDVAESAEQVLRPVGLDGHASRGGDLDAIRPIRPLQATAAVREGLLVRVQRVLEFCVMRCAPANESRKRKAKARRAEQAKGKAQARSSLLCASLPGTRRATPANGRRAELSRALPGGRERLTLVALCALDGLS
jgi:hypothetical protein